MSKLLRINPTTFTLLLVFVMFGNSLFGQEKKSKNKIYSLNVIDDLLDTKQQKTNKVLQANTFGEGVAPEKGLFSVDILTEREIQSFGAVSVPEILRQVPGVIVKQLSSGVYEVYLQSDMRLHGNGNPVAMNNTPFLLMIDFEPIELAYNHQIAWETLPVGIDEITQIEVFKSSQPVWYGSQAVSGVIHIIRDLEGQQKLASVRLGNQRNFHASVKIPISTDKIQTTVGGHFNYTDKPDSEFYIWDIERYVQADSALLFQSNAEQTNLFSRQSMRSAGGNFKIRYSPKEDYSLTFNGNANFSESNLPSLYIDQIAETRRKSTRYSGTFNAKIKKLSARLLYRNEQLNMAEGYGGFFFNTQLLSSDLNYLLSISDAFSIQPLLSFRLDSYKNTEDDEEDTRYGKAFNGTEKRQNVAGGVNINVRPSDKTQFYAGFRAEQSSLAKDMLLGFHLASSLQLGEKTFVKTSLARANMQPTLEAWSFNRTFTNQNNLLRSFIGNDDLDLPTINKADISVQFPVAKIVSSKVELFYNMVDNPILQSLSFTSSGNQELIMQNGSGSASSYGISASAKATLGVVSLNAHLTWQQQNLDGLLANRALFTYSPEIYGGFGIISSFLSDKLLLSSNVYYGMENNNSIPLWSENANIGFVIGARADYKIWQQSRVFIEVKEFGVPKEYQSPFANRINARYLLGGTLEF